METRTGNEFCLFVAFFEKQEGLEESIVIVAKERTSSIENVFFSSFNLTKSLQ